MNDTHIIWDWNGTLLNDISWCMTSMNIMLRKRGLPTLESIDAYHKVFGFPVKEYYRRVGFDFETEAFETLAAEYIALYHRNDNNVALYPEVRTILSEFQFRGIHQIILSASEHKNLMSQIEPFGIEHYFDEILGISDIFATSKIDMGKEYIQRVMPKRAVLIGDTLHDKEVADALGVDCILVANGHQSKETLLSCEVTVIDRLPDIVKFIEHAAQLPH
jgi:phosphoglycolate phosphatase